MQILLLAAVNIVDAPMQNQFRGAAFDLFQGDFAEQGDRVLIQLAPAGWIEIAK